MAEFILKDWYGKNCTFDDDKIFVQDANGELVEFTQGKGESTLAPLEITENGTYTPSEGVDGFDSVVVEVPTPDVKLQDKTITENGTFTADAGFDGLGQVIVDVLGMANKPNVVKKSGSFYNKTTSHTVTHNMGFIPDIIIIMCIGKFSSSKDLGNTGLVAYVGGKTRDFLLKNSYYMQLNNGILTCNRSLRDWTQEKISYGYIANITETSFDVGPCLDNGQYDWLALGGLTE